MGGERYGYGAGVGESEKSDGGANEAYDHARRTGRCVGYKTYFIYVQDPSSLSDDNPNFNVH